MGDRDYDYQMEIWESMIESVVGLVYGEVSEYGRPVGTDRFTLMADMNKVLR